MENWMERFERRKDEAEEKELNGKLEKLLNLLDEAYRDKDRIKIIKKIIEVYDALRINACDYNEKDYIQKKKELAEIIYKIKRQEHMETAEYKSWKEYQEEEQICQREEEER